MSATEALNMISNKRVKRSTMDSPAASAFSFDMSALFEVSNEEAFPSLEWSFDDAEEEETASVDSASSSLSLSSLGKRSRSEESGLNRSKTLRSSIDLMG